MNSTTKDFLIGLEMSIRSLSNHLICLHLIIMKRYQVTFDQSLLKKLRNMQKSFSNDWMNFKMHLEFWKILRIQQSSFNINRKHLQSFEWKSLHAKILKRNSKFQMSRNQNISLHKLIFYSWLWLISINMENGEELRMLFELTHFVDSIIYYFQELSKRFRNESTLLLKLLKRMLKMLSAMNKFLNWRTKKSKKHIILECFDNLKSSLMSKSF